MLDVLGAQYVVTVVASTAPTRTDATALSAIGYRYAGAKVQAGGRGILGFSTIGIFDAATVDGGWTITEFGYCQDFPFVGSPLQTNKWILSGARSPAAAPRSTPAPPTPRQLATIASTTGRRGRRHCTPQLRLRNPSGVRLSPRKRFALGVQGQW